MSASRGAAPFQFGLRSVLTGTLAVATLCAVWRGLGPIWGPAVVWLVVLATTHVVSNAWGRRAFRPSPERRASPPRPASSAGAPLGEPGRNEPGAETNVARSPIAERASPTAGERRGFAIATLLGATLGAGVGATCWSGEPRTALALSGALVTAASLAVLGGAIAGLSAAAAPAIWRAMRRAA